MEETVFKSEQRVSRDQAVGKLEQITDKLREGGLELSSGADSVSLEVPDELELEVKVEEDSRDGEISLEIELEWSTAGDSGELEIS